MIANNLVGTTASSSAASNELGINYDPVHSAEFTWAMAQDNTKKMEDLIKADLDAIKTFCISNKVTFTHIKTFFLFFQGFEPNKGGEVVDFVKILNDWNKDNPNYAMKLAIGLYQFRAGIDSCPDTTTCESWTNLGMDYLMGRDKDGNINSKMSPFLLYPALITRVVIGNENLSGDKAEGIAQRMIDQVNILKSFFVENSITDVKIGTAQEEPVLDVLLDPNYAGNSISANGRTIKVKPETIKTLFETLDFIGYNAYPFWGNTPIDVTLSLDNNPGSIRAKVNTALNLTAKYNSTNQQNSELIITEEGWPSAFTPNDGDISAGSPTTSSGGTKALGSPENIRKYFVDWNTRMLDTSTPPTPSYYFAAFDKIPGLGVESHWGLISADVTSDIFSPNGKVLKKGVLIDFKNKIGVGTSGDFYGGKDIFVSACSDEDASKNCRPIYGFTNSGFIKKTPDVNGTTKKLYVDNTGNTYQSLLVVANIQGANGQEDSYPQVCWVKKEELLNLKENSEVVITWPQINIGQPCTIIDNN